MRGRRGIVRPKNEKELNDFRFAFAQMFVKLKKEYGIDSYIAHNMTVTPTNLDQVTEVARDVLAMPYSMLSFQPAAYVGDERRWDDHFEEVTIDSVWSRVEEGVGVQLPWQAIQFGDPRCNRSTVVMIVDGAISPLLDPKDPRDLLVRDLFLNHFGGVIFGGQPALILAAKIIRVLGNHPKDLYPVLAFGSRLLKRAGGLITVANAARKQKLQFKTFVVHNFMDASVVKPAWEMMEQGVTATDPNIKEVQERLAACSYAMSHPETGRLVPACVQHSVLDPVENIELRRLLPLVEMSSKSAPARV